MIDLMVPVDEEASESKENRIPIEAIFHQLTTAEHEIGHGTHGKSKRTSPNPRRE